MQLARRCRKPPAIARAKYMSERGTYTGCLVSCTYARDCPQMCGNFFQWIDDAYAGPTKWLPRESIDYRIMEIPCSDRLDIFFWTIQYIFERRASAIRNCWIAHGIFSGFQKSPLSFLCIEIYELFKITSIIELVDIIRRRGFLMAFFNTCRTIFMGI